MPMKKRSFFPLRLLFSFFRIVFPVWSSLLRAFRLGSFVPPSGSTDSFVPWNLTLTALAHRRSKFFCLPPQTHAFGKNSLIGNLQFVIPWNVLQEASEKGLISSVFRCQDFRTLCSDRKFWGETVGILKLFLVFFTDRKIPYDRSGVGPRLENSSSSLSSSIIVMFQ